MKVTENYSCVSEDFTSVYVSRYSGCGRTGVSVLSCHSERTLLGCWERPAGAQEEQPEGRRERRPASRMLCSTHTSEPAYSEGPGARLLRSSLVEVDLSSVWTLSHLSNLSGTWNSAGRTSSSAAATRRRTTPSRRRTGTSWTSWKLLVMSSVKTH